MINQVVDNLTLTWWSLLTLVGAADGRERLAITAA